MRTLREFLLAEAKDDKVEEETKSVGRMDIGSWKSLRGISPGALSNEIKEILKIDSAKDAKLASDTDKIKAVTNPSKFQSDIKISQKKSFEDLIEASVKNSARDFKEFFTGSVKYFSHPRRGMIAQIGLSESGSAFLKKDKQLIRFYKFWFDCIFWACLKDGISPRKRDSNDMLRYKIDKSNVYVHYTKA